MDIKKIILLMAGIMFFLSACHKDMGNYDISMPETPIVTNLDSVYPATAGDSLIISPKIASIDAKDIELQWRISVIEGNDVNFVGPSLRIIFGLKAKRYPARLTVYNKANGMKYFHSFFIDGGTEFGKGSAVLSVENGITQFSFVKPDGSVQPRLYKAITGKDLPPNPLNLFLMVNKNTGNTLLGYFIVTKNGGVRLEPNTMQEEEKYPTTLKANFFAPPDNLEVGSLKANEQGVLMGVVNGTLFTGTTNTWDQAATYGMFGAASTETDYELAPSFVMTPNAGTYFVCFERNKKQFVRFNITSGPVYFDTQYTAQSTNIFDPKNVGMDLIHMEQLNNADCFAYCKSADGKIYELMFDVMFYGDATFTPVHKRLFIRPDLITENTKWQGAKNGVIYLGVGSKVYRYNPLNQEVKELVTDFGGKTVTMVKISQDEQTLMVGTEGAIYYLDITTGKYGVFIKKIEGIPGSPVDMTIR